MQRLTEPDPIRIQRISLVNPGTRNFLETNVYNFSNPQHFYCDCWQQKVIGMVTAFRIKELQEIGAPEAETLTAFDRDPNGA